MKWAKRGDTRDTWYGRLDDRQLAEVEFARLYAEKYEHGTDGHNRLLLVAKLADLLDQFQSQLRMANQAPAVVAWSDIAASAYRAYAASTGNKNYQGLPMPEWKDLTPAIRTAWEAAVRQADSISAVGSILDESRWANWQSPSELDV